MGDYIALSGLAIIVFGGCCGIVVVWRANDLLPENPRGSPSQVTWQMISEYERLRPHSVLPRLVYICIPLGLGLAVIGGVISAATGR